MNEKIDKFKHIVINNNKNKDFIYHEWMVEYHLDIVEKIAMELCDIYSNANRDIVKTLVWFHDFGKSIDEENEKSITLTEGTTALKNCGFEESVINKVVEYWELMERKNEIDISQTPIEIQIISSADGASHFIGPFYATFFGDGEDFVTTQQKLRNKINVDWNRKIVLPEVKKAFQKDYIKTLELIGELPNKFLI